MSKITIAELLARKEQDGKIAMLTAYDYPMAKLVDEAGVDLVLVGDSLGMVVLGYETTAPVTMDEMIHHARAVRRGVARALLVGDMPLMALRASAPEVLRHATRFVQEAGCDAVKVEWREGIDDSVRTMVGANIPVMGHVGLTPQTAASEGGFGLRGKDAESAKTIIAQAQGLERAGCFAIVLECLPDPVAQEITKRLRIPTIGIGSGPHCDGQVLVLYDAIGLYERLKPKFAKRYADAASLVRGAASAFVNEVRSGTFPGKEQTPTMAPDEADKLRRELDRKNSTQPSAHSRQSK
ncbi:MAG: 3-methyl-2-oxobutanoate hydroxymethyltransferase [Candidatus Omnitrophica bacterium]|nr:3-methyl-2-oxobutanoate hydroxymethyltransferase [Candidatus Omnitrophota bacterium]